MTTADAPAAPTATSAESAPRGASWLELAVLVALVILGAVIRAHGFTSLDLWYDDAWAAAPARVPLAKAVHMVLTAPGYGLALRTWLRFDPATTWFGQLPAFVLGVAAIPVVYALLRWFRSPRWVALAGAAVIAVGPLAVQYSTRLKEYPFDLLASCVILVLAERVRRVPSTRTLAWLAGTSVVSFFVSAGTATVIAGTWAALVLLAVSQREHAAKVASWLTATGVGCLVVWGAFLRHLPTVLSYNWRRRGFLLDYHSLPRFERSVTLIFGGFFHAVLAYPVPSNYYQARLGAHAPFVALLGAVLLGVAVATPLTGAIRARHITPATPAALTLLIAILLAAAGSVPLGDGRTDEVLYPALLVCLAAVVAAVTPRVRRAVGEGSAQRVIATAVAVTCLVGACAFGVTHTAKYPTVGLRSVAARTLPLVQPGDVVFVDTFNSFGWCYYRITPCRYQVGGAPLWPQGFRPVSTRPWVFIATHNSIPLPELTRAQALARRIWYVGFTYGTFDVGTDPARFNVPVTTYFTGLLAKDGWRPARFGTQTVVFGIHVYAQLLVRRGPRG